MDAHPYCSSLPLPPLSSPSPPSAAASRAGSKVGLYTWGGLAIVAVGLVCLGYAGVLKEREQKKDTVPLLARDSERTINGTGGNTGGMPPTPAPPSFRVGLIYCLLSGIFSPMLNLSLSFGQCVGEDLGG